MLTRPNDIQDDRRRLSGSLRITLIFSALLWVIHSTEVIFHLNFVRFGVYPNHLDGLVGIPLGPLIHGSWSHLISNTFAIIVVGRTLFYGYPKSAKLVLPVVWLGSGTGVWLFAREVHHIGASGLTFGVMFFLFVVGALRWDKRAIVLSMIVFFLYGSMIWGIFPLQPGISFESHLFGAACGVVMAFLLRNYDPAPEEKHYSWEDEADEEDYSPDSDPGDNP